MDEKQFDRLLAGLPDDYHPPPPAPRDRIWRRIETRRRAERVARWPRRILRPAAVAAAALLVGILVGRQLWPTREPGPTSVGARVPASTQGMRPTPAAEGRAAAPASPHAGHSLQWTAARLLGRAETFLTYVRDAQAGDATNMRRTQWARDLLSETRMLLDAPAGRGTAMDALLRDLELVLVQIVRCDQAPVPRCEAIEVAIDRHALMARLASVGQQPPPAPRAL
ncbi:MAG: hypothetical protein GF330_04975 [Candidatus Eisenbacteria bacterium]|nr:hypothetical protein [Candidatus Eisenbacteria bacterium]